MEHSFETSSPRRRGQCLGTVRPKFVVFACSLLFTLTANAAKPDPVHDYGFQIVAADDSAITRRITEDLYKRLVPVFG
ncbi:MAG: hypothetical protein EOP02_23080, partial [Proteobacteria bacterium]